MDENDKTSRYNEMRRFAQQFTYVYEVGVTIEIEEFFFHRLIDNTVKNFTLLFDNDIKHYKGITTLEDYSKAAVHDLFMSLFRIISIIRGEKKRSSGGMCMVCSKVQGGRDPQEQEHVLAG